MKKVSLSLFSALAICLAVFSAFTTTNAPVTDVYKIFYDATPSLAPGSVVQDYTQISTNFSTDDLNASGNTNVSPGSTKDLDNAVYFDETGGPDILYTQFCPSGDSDVCIIEIVDNGVTQEVTDFLVGAWDDVR